jgi:two-component system sensor histidine kinase DesK
MEWIRGTVTAKQGASVWRLLILLLLTVLWMEGDSGVEGVVLLLSLTIIALLRWRLVLSGWVILIDQVLCLVFIPHWSGAWFGFALPLFEAMRVNKIWFALPILVALIVYGQTSLMLIFFLILSAFVGWVLYHWMSQVAYYRHEADDERKQRYELEQLNGDLLAAQIQVAQMAEISERKRIAQELHDRVGHELAGATLALQAFERLWEDGDAQSKDMFDLVQQRLQNCSRDLRETVHNMMPVQALGIDRLEEVCLDYTVSPLHFRVDGDTTRVPVYIWSILEPCLKEALTNVGRHAKANRVDVTLDVSDHIVRLSVYNDGVRETERIENVGFGLRNLRQRAKAVGGNISSSVVKDGFMLVCVLPLEKDGRSNENSDRG